jgi:HAD superfamily hydrolase (TIGR01509 family)
MTADSYRAVLFDWRRTLVHDPDLGRWLEKSLTAIGRSPAEAASIERAVIEALERPEYAELDRRMDTSAEQHRTDMLTVFGWAGLDAELSNALYEQDFDPSSHELYPDVIDALTRVRERGIKTGLVSNIHFDLRPELQTQGVLDLLDAVVLSFEHGVQKPDRRIFQIALDELGVRSSETIMVGDSKVHDGAAADLGIKTLILPTLSTFGPRDFGSVLHLLDSR